MDEILTRAILTAGLHYCVMPYLDISDDSLEKGLYIAFYISQAIYVVIYVIILSRLLKQTWLAKTVPVLRSKPADLLEGFEWF